MTSTQLSASAITNPTPQPASQTQIPLTVLLKTCRTKIPKEKISSTIFTGYGALFEITEVFPTFCCVTIERYTVDPISE